jgi:hypothetical protein
MKTKEVAKIDWGTEMGSFLPVDCQRSQYSHIHQEALKMSKE